MVIRTEDEYVAFGRANNEVVGFAEYEAGHTMAAAFICEVATVGELWTFLLT
jgi:hypothetical protein